MNFVKEYDRWRKKKKNTHTQKQLKKLEKINQKFVKRNWRKTK